MPTNGNNKLLLVAQDAAPIAALSRALAERGHTVLTAANGAAGLLAAHAENPALVVAEVELPVMSGYRMAEALRSDAVTRDLTLILLLPHADEDEMARGWLSGADFCVAGDIPTDDLLLLIERSLAAARQCLVPSA